MRLSFLSFVHQIEKRRLDCEEISSLRALGETCQPRVELREALRRVLLAVVNPSRNSARTPDALPSSHGTCKPITRPKQTFCPRGATRQPEHACIQKDREADREYVDIGKRSPRTPRHEGVLRLIVVSGVRCACGNYTQPIWHLFCRTSIATSVNAHTTK